MRSGSLVAGRAARWRARPHWRRCALAVAAAVGGGPVLRLCLGRWPRPHERRRFAHGVVAGDPVVPAILRGLSELPAAKEPLGRLALLHLVREGAVAAPAGPAAPSIPAPAGNPLSWWRGPPISFLHFERAAGTSLAHAMTESFHPMQIDDDPARGAAPHVASAFPPHAAARLGARPLVWGHYDLPALRRLGPGRVLVTILRRPAERIVSLYRFWRSIGPDEPGAHGFNVAAAHALDLHGFLRAPDPLIRNYIDNVYVRRLAGAYIAADGADPLAADPAACLHQALRALDGIDIVATVEQLDVGLRPLAGIGVRLPTFLPRRNGVGGPAGAAPDELRRLTWLDDIVYDHACRRSGR